LETLGAEAQKKIEKRKTANDRFRPPDCPVRVNKEQKGKTGVVSDRKVASGRVKNGKKSGLGKSLENEGGDGEPYQGQEIGNGGKTMTQAGQSETTIQSEETTEFQSAKVEAIRRKAAGAIPGDVRKTTAETDSNAHETKGIANCKSQRKKNGRASSARGTFKEKVSS